MRSLLLLALFLVAVLSLSEAKASKGKAPATHKNSHAQPDKKQPLKKAKAEKKVEPEVEKAQPPKKTKAPKEEKKSEPEEKPHKVEKREAEPEPEHDKSAEEAAAAVAAEAQAEHEELVRLIRAQVREELLAEFQATRPKIAKPQRPIAPAQVVKPVLVKPPKVKKCLELSLAPEGEQVESVPVQRCSCSCRPPTDPAHPEGVSSEHESESIAELVGDAAAEKVKAELDEEHPEEIASVEDI